MTNSIRLALLRDKLCDLNSRDAVRRANARHAIRQFGGNLLFFASDLVSADSSAIDSPSPSQIEGGDEHGQTA